MRAADADTDDADRSPAPRADVCVVGSGPAGALTAHSLARRGHDVVILEAGKRFDMDSLLERMENSLRPSTNALDIWEMGGERDRYTVSGDVHYRVNANRVKGVGGTSLHWSGMCPRFHEKDFEMQSRYGLARDWPIDYADLRPYYARAEKAIGIAGAADNPFAPPREEPFPVEAFPPSYSDSLFADALEELGITMHTAPRAQVPVAHDGRSQCLAFGTCSPVCPSGSKYNATVHVRRAEEEGARVISRAPVTRLEHGSDGERVEAAVYRTPDGSMHRQEARHFVVACGAIETARLLLLSQSEQYPDGLANTSGAVGRYFMCHPSIDTVARLGEPTEQHQIGFPTSISHQFYDHDQGAGSVQLEFDNSAGPGLSNFAFGGQTGLTELQDAAGSPTDVGEWRGVANAAIDGTAWGDDLLASMRDGFGDYVSIIGIVEQLPEKRNRVALNTDVTDEYGNPVPDVRLSVGAHAERSREQAAEVEQDIMKALGVRPGTMETQEALSPHQMGTTRMGTDPAESVVDSRLRTHDLANLSIASASTFVTGAAVNPTLTIAALSLKAADHVHEDL